MTEVKIDLDKVINKTKESFSGKKEKGLANQLVTGDRIPKPSKPNEYIWWPDSFWHLLTGVPGLPFGKIIQVCGKPDSGKSTLAMKFMGLAQEQKHQVIFWDVEDKFGANRFDKYFGKSSDLLVVPNKNTLDGADQVSALADTFLDIYPDKKILLVIDSIGGLMSKSSKTNNLRDGKQLAEAAKENGQMLRHFVMKMEEYRDRESLEEKMGVLLINQVYANIGSVGNQQSGGWKVKYHSSLIVELARMADLLKTRDKVQRKVGIKTKATIKKNHLLDSEDTIYKMALDVLAGTVTVNEKDPVNSLVSNDCKAIDAFEPEAEDTQWGDDS